MPRIHQFRLDDVQVQRISTDLGPGRIQNLEFRKFALFVADRSGRDPVLWATLKRYILGAHLELSESFERLKKYV